MDPFFVGADFGCPVIRRNSATLGLRFERFDELLDDLLQIGLRSQRNPLPFPLFEESLQISKVD